MNTCAVCQEREAVATLVMPGPVRHPVCYECQQQVTRVQRPTLQARVEDLFGGAYAGASFDSFRGAEDRDFFHEYRRRIAGSSITAHSAHDLKQLTAIRSDVEDFTRHLVSEGNGRIFLSGGPGTGKTHLLASACRVLIDEGATVAVRSAYDFVAEMLATHSSRQASERQAQNEIIANLSRYDVVVIDDLNQEVITDSTPRYIGWLFMELVRQGSILMVASQLTVSQLSQEAIGTKRGLGPGVMDRLSTAPSCVSRLPKMPSYRNVQTHMRGYVE